MSEKVDFTVVIDRIFQNKGAYSLLTDKEKEDNFFMVNRKFAVKYLKHTQFLNSKYIDKTIALDIWSYFFRNVTGTPKWYWAKSKKNKTSTKNITKSDKERLKEYLDLNEDDYNFLSKYYQDDVDYEIKKLKRFD